jgi:hypothetical protein
LQRPRRHSVRPFLGPVAPISTVISVCHRQLQ